MRAVTRRDALGLLLGLAISSGIACTASGRPGASATAAPDAGASARGLDASGVPDLEPGPARTPTPLADDPLWQRAARGDAIDLQRLADREGAVGLIAAVEIGRSLGLTALAALPYAEDGELALGRLCELAPRVEGSGRRALLVAIRGVIGAMSPDRERLAAEDLKPCAEALARLARDFRLAPADRDLASSSGAALGDYLEPNPAP